MVGASAMSGKSENESLVFDEFLPRIVASLKQIKKLLKILIAP